jgi:hypothetical protein
MKIYLKEQQGRYNWHDWFVLLPRILVDHDTQRKFLVCFQTVRRKREVTKSMQAYWIYRLFKNDNIQTNGRG